MTAAGGVGEVEKHARILDDRGFAATARAAFASLAPLFRYPESGLSAGITTAVARVANLDIGAADALAKFAAEVEPLDPGAAQSTYTHTFDLAPSCSPYLGAHLFDEESRDRARLMVGLRMTYRRAGIDLDDRELPDHISLVLDCAPSFEEEEWCDLGRLILVPALKKMEEILRPTTNPWRHLFGAARRLAETTFADGGAL